MGRFKGMEVDHEHGQQNRQLVTFLSQIGHRARGQGWETLCGGDAYSDTGDMSRWRIWRVTGGKLEIATYQFLKSL